MTSVKRSTAVRVGGLALTAVAVAVALTACGTAVGGAGEAAKVGSSALPVQTVLDQSAEVVALSQAAGTQKVDTTQVNRVQVAVWVEQQLTAKLAAELGVSVSDAEVDQFLGQVATQNRTTRAQFEKQFAVQPGTWVPPSTLVDYTRTYLLQQAIGEKLLPTGTNARRSAALNKEIARVADAEGVTVSPRFGSWDAANTRVTAPNDDLSAPQRITAPTLSDNPAPPSQG